MGGCASQEASSAAAQRKIKARRKLKDKDTQGEMEMAQTGWWRRRRRRRQLVQRCWYTPYCNWGPLPSQRHWYKYSMMYSFRRTNQGCRREQSYTKDGKRFSPGQQPRFFEYRSTGLYTQAFHTKNCMAKRIDPSKLGQKK